MCILNLESNVDGVFSASKLGSLLLSSLCSSNSLCFLNVSIILSTTKGLDALGLFKDIPLPGVNKESSTHTKNTMILDILEMGLKE